MNKNNLTINLQIITPEKLICQEEVYQVNLPVVGGDVAILPNHISYIGLLKPGEIIYKKNKTDEHGESLVVAGGFVEFNENKLVVLADEAEMAYDIDLEKVEKAKKRAEDIRNKVIQVSDSKYAQTAAILEREMAKMKVAKKYLSRKGKGF